MEEGRVIVKRGVSGMKGEGRGEGREGGREEGRKG